MTKEQFVEWIEKLGYTRWDYTHEPEGVLRDFYQEQELVYYEKSFPDDKMVRVTIEPDRFQIIGFVGSRCADMFGSLYSSGFIGSDGKWTPKDLKNKHEWELPEDGSHKVSEGG